MKTARQLRVELRAANARADEAEREQANLLADYKQRADECDKFERALTAYRAESARLREDLNDFDDAHAVTAAEWKATRARLTAATKLLRRVVEEGWTDGQIDGLAEDVRTYLAAQPAPAQDYVVHNFGTDTAIAVPVTRPEPSTLERIAAVADDQAQTPEDMWDLVSTIITEARARGEL